MTDVMKFDKTIEPKNLESIIEDYAAQLEQANSQRNASVIERFDCSFLLDEDKKLSFDQPILGKSFSWQQQKLSNSDSDEIEQTRPKRRIRQKMSLNLSDGENCVKDVFTKSYGSGGRLSLFSCSHKDESTGSETFYGSFMDSVGNRSVGRFSAATFGRSSSVYKAIVSQQIKNQQAGVQVHKLESQKISEDNRESEDSLNDRSDSIELQEGQINNNHINDFNKKLKKFSEDNKTNEEIKTSTSKLQQIGGSQEDYQVDYKCRSGSGRKHFVIKGIQSQELDASVREDQPFSQEKVNDFFQHSDNPSVQMNYDGEDEVDFEDMDDTDEHCDKKLTLE